MEGKNMKKKYFLVSGAFWLCILVSLASRSPEAFQPFMYPFTCNQRCSTNTPTIHGTHRFPGDRPKCSQSVGLKYFLHKPEVIAEEICKHESRRLKKKKEASSVFF